MLLLCVRSNLLQCGQALGFEREPPAAIPATPTDDVFETLFEGQRLLWRRRLLRQYGQSQDLPGSEAHYNATILHDLSTNVPPKHYDLPGTMVAVT